MPCRTHFYKSWMQRSIMTNEKVSYLYLGVLPENRWMLFLHSTSHYSLRKSLKDLNDHLNFFVSCQGRSQLSLAIFMASRNHLVASKHSYMLQLSKSVLNGQSVQVNMAYDLIYSMILENVFYFENTHNFEFVPKLLKFFNILDLRHQFSGAGGGSTPAGCR